MLIDIPGIIKKGKLWIEKRKGDDCKLTQREANMLCEGGTIDVADYIANYMNLIMTCCFYSPMMPQALPIAFISSFCGYWITKYHLLRRCKAPDMFSEIMATFFSNMMPWLVLAWCISTYIFLIILKLDIENKILKHKGKSHLKPIND